MDSSVFNASGFLTITDLESNEVVLESKNAVHFGNLSVAVAKSLASDSTGHIKWVAFGNGASSITSSQTIFYRTPNVSPLRDASSSLYNETYRKDVLINNADNNINTDISSPNYADVNIVCTLDTGEPAGQDLTDNASDNNGDFVFDEIGLISGDGLLLTHAIFHPLQKSLNRKYRVEYTLRILMGTT